MYEGWLALSCQPGLCRRVIGGDTSASAKKPPFALPLSLEPISNRNATLAFIIISSTLPKSTKEIFHRPSNNFNTVKVEKSTFSTVSYLLTVIREIRRDISCWSKIFNLVIHLY
jgi:hypothetical protein